MDAAFQKIQQSPKLRPATKHNYETYYRLYVRPVFGHLQPVEVTPEVLEKQFGIWREEGAPVHSIRKHLRPLLPPGMLANVRLPRQVGRIKMPKAEDMERAFATTGSPFFREFATLALTGMRPAELRGLQWQDLDGNALHIQRIIEDGEILPTKTVLSNRKIKLPERLLPIIGKPGKSIWMFTMRDGVTPLSGRALREHMRAFCKRAKIPHIRPYALRHYFATTMFRNGMPPKAIQEYLGHASLQMLLQHYLHAIAEDFDMITEFAGSDGFLQYQPPIKLMEGWS